MNEIIIENAKINNGVNLFFGNQTIYFEKKELAFDYINKNLSCDYADVKIVDRT